MKNRFAFFTIALAALLSGCNTVHGIGQDVQGAGNAISRAAR
ncbi:MULTISPECIES: entericidin A/B family lipoprotein [Comamonas]|uniref:Entericidin A/B family lipoprotein n=1 Tax=Comamonas squillarum TaxID=2977320 RepID=A0ABY5ZXV5_9BURK|nr:MULTISPECIES: entericidin A/B family lipoprotein [Comamonas]UXC18288.1 entericidin A/B family lipoprotein [Comamonas sp. PR12]